MTIEEEIHKLQLECGCQAAAVVLLLGVALIAWSLIAWSSVIAMILIPTTFFSTGAAKLRIVHRAQRKAARLIAEHG